MTSPRGESFLELAQRLLREVAKAKAGVQLQAMGMSKSEVQEFVDQCAVVAQAEGRDLPTVLRAETRAELQRRARGSTDTAPSTEES